MGRLPPVIDTRGAARPLRRRESGVQYPCQSRFTPSPAPPPGPRGTRVKAAKSRCITRYTGPRIRRQSRGSGERHCGARAAAIAAFGISEVKWKRLIISGRSESDASSAARPTPPRIPGFPKDLRSYRVGIPGGIRACGYASEDTGAFADIFESLRSRPGIPKAIETMQEMRTFSVTATIDHGVATQQAAIQPTRPSTVEMPMRPRRRGLGSRRR